MVAIDSDYPPLAGGALDRAATTRMDAEALRAAWRAPRARVLRMRGAEIPVVPHADGPRLSLLPVPSAPDATEYEAEGVDGRARHLFVGLADGAPVFAAAADDGDAGRPDEEWRHAFAAGGLLPELEREMVAVASGLLRWHELGRFSAADGSLTSIEQGGWMRRDAHGGEHFPRTDPAVIVLVEHDGRVLLGSNALWETGRFSLLAGFVEAGESLEQTVRREVLEESGVRLGEVEYMASQPWPFPRSLMIGFRARLAPGADPEDLQADPEEISELRWFSRDELRDPAPGIVLPQSLSIARWMIDRWVAEEPARGE